MENSKNAAIGKAIVKPVSGEPIGSQLAPLKTQSLATDPRDLKKGLESCLRDLHLPTIRGIYEDEARRATSETIGYERYLFSLVEQEMAERKSKRVDRLLRDSRLPLEKTLESFDMKRLPQKVQLQVRTLIEGHFLDRAENVLAFGKPGSGKTHLLCAIAQTLIRKSRRLYYTTSSTIVQELLAAKRDLKLAAKLKTLAHFDAILIDDIGYVQQSREEMEVLFTLLSDRYERKSVMITSNLPFSDWEKIFKDPMTTAAAIDRLVHHCVILELNIASYRIEQAKKRKE
jgi:DNA replication protein DnaC